MFSALSVLTLSFATPNHVQALTPIAPPDPKPGSFGLEATKMKDPPQVGATISIPTDGTNYTTPTTTVGGICPTDLLVQIYNNDVMVGSVMCENGSYSIEISLFAGTNELSARVFDELDQTGPVSNIRTVNYTDTNFTAFGELITLTSTYGRRSTPAGSQINWPLQLSGGSGPYAFSIDWGDGTSAELKSQSLAGLVAMAHVYKKAGIYQVNVKVSDVNGASAFLQVVAVASGQPEPDQQPVNSVATKTVVLWVPAMVALFLLFPTYWLGKRSKLTEIKHRLLKERDEAKKAVSGKKPDS